MPADELPFIDEHAIDVARPAEVTWDAVVETFGRRLDGRAVALGATLLGCEPAGKSSLDGSMGSTVPGFRVTASERPDLLVLQGRHRFSRYAIVVRVDSTPTGSRCRLESRGEFPGPLGRLYRLAVIRSGGQVLAVRSQLRSVRSTANG